MRTSKEWKNLVGRKAKLVNQQKKSLPTFDEHKSFLLRQGKIYKNLSDQELKIRHEEYLGHLKTFNGLCRTGEIIEFVPTDRKDVIVVSKDWKGKLTLHSDLELWLWQEFKLSSLKMKFKCQMYSFGQISVPKQSALAYFEGTGSTLVSNSLGIYEVIFDNYQYPSRIQFNLNDGMGSSQFGVFELI